MYALVRTSGDPLAVARAAQAAVWAIDQNQPVHSIRTVEALLAVISNEVVHSGLLGKNGRYHTFRSIREEAPSEASS